MWNDGRRNCDTPTAVFDYGSFDNPDEGFQVIYSSRQTNSSGGVKERYFSNGGKLDLDTNIMGEGGLTKDDARGMGMKPFILDTFNLPQIKAESGADTGFRSPHHRPHAKLDGMREKQQHKNQCTY